ncbi:MAG: radical SAM protein [Candidatus Omnitrophota bacterium]|nr:radical SAM protein [Candidatus Omnitrophota bacterium]
MMKITIVYPPFGVVENQPNIKAVAENYGVFPCLSLAYVAAVFESCGCTVQFIDANALSLSKEEVLKLVKDFNPDLLCFTITTYLFHQTLEWVKYLKQNTGIRIIVGGMHLSLYPKETLTNEWIDYAIVGEAETVLPNFIKALSKNKGVKKVKGLCFKEKGRIVFTGVPGLLKDINSAPFPARHLLPNEKYYSFISKRKNFTGIITTRGCPYKCIFCEQGNKPYRKRSAFNVVDEIEECYNNYKIREIDVFDSSFSIDKRRVLSICKELKKRNLDVSWSIRTRVDLVNEEMLKAMKDSGCTRIYYGIESGDQKILETIRKTTDLELIKKTVYTTKKIGIDTFGYFMIGNPGETKETVLKTIKLAKSLDLDYAQFSKVSSLPGTELYELLKKDLGYDYWREYTLDESKRMTLPRHNCSFSEEEVDCFIKHAYKQFYFRPGYVFKSLKRLKSFWELKRGFKAALSMIQD